MRVLFKRIITRSLLLLAAGITAVYGQSPVLVGVTRWDGYAKTIDSGSVYQTVLRVMGNKKWDDPALDYWPWFSEVDSSGNLIDFNENTVSIMEQENQYAHDAGIDYWAFLRYRDTNIDPYCGPINEQYYRYQESSNKGLMKFCWILSHSFSAWEIEKPKIIQALKDSLYVKVLGNRPLVYFYDNYTAAQMADFRAVVQAAGMANPYIVAWTVYGMGEDATSIYLTQAGCAWNGQSYSDFISAVSNEWRTLSGCIVPWTPMNTDIRPWAEGPAAWWPGAPDIWTVPPTPSEFAAMVQNGVDYVKQNPSICPSNTVIIKEWNGPEESGLVMPGRHHGAAKLNGLKNVNKAGSNNDGYRMGLWPLDGSADDSAGLLNGTASGGSSYVSGKKGQALHFDGVDGLMEVPDNPSLDGMAQLTLCAFVNMDTLPAQNYEPLGKYCAYRFIIGNNGSAHFVVATQSNAWYSTGTSAGSGSALLSAHQWYYLAGVYDGRRTRFYINGVPMDSGAQDISGAVINNSAPFSLGKSTYATIDRFKGSIDEVRLRNRALSDSEIAALYASYNDGTGLTKRGFGPGPIGLSAFPNPFNPETAIHFTLDKQADIAIGIYDARGECVRALKNGKQPPGAHSVIWNGRDNSGKLLPSGIYLVRLMGTGREETKSVLFVK